MTVLVATHKEAGRLQMAGNKPLLRNKQSKPKCGLAISTTAVELGRCLNKKTAPVLEMQKKVLSAMSARKGKSP